VSIFDMWVIKPWKSSPKAPVDPLPLEVLKSRLNALLAALLPFEEGFIRGNEVAASPHLLTSHVKGCCRGRTHLPLPTEWGHWGQSPRSAWGQGCLFGRSSMQAALLLSITLALG